MGFKIPEYLKGYLNTEWRKPPNAYVSTAQYYANLPPYFTDYMRTVVRPCLAYANGVADGDVNNNLRTNVGFALKKAAVKLIVGEKVLFNGSDAACAFLSDVWANKVGFDAFFEQAVDYLCGGGTAVVKLDIDRFGRCRPTAVRADRAYTVTDSLGDIVDMTVIVSLLFSQKIGAQRQQYWLVERRYYNGEGKPCVKFLVHMKSGTARSEVLPVTDGEGIPFDQLDGAAQSVLKKQGVRVNEEMLLPFRTLGAQQWRLTAANSVVPGLAMGDPLLYGALDILFAIDTVFCGSLIDVISGKGKVLLPQRFIEEIRKDLEPANVQLIPYNQEAPDDTFEYVTTAYDKDFKPEAVQFDIRAEKYSGMLEMYLKLLASVCGFAPTTVFPFLADNSTKTATEVRSEDNMSDSTVKEIHKQLSPKINEMITEVLRFHGFTGDATVQLSDYVGNPIQRDENLRQNYTTGAIPQEVFIQRISGLTRKEAAEWKAVIQKEQKEKQAQPFDGLDIMSQ